VGERALHKAIEQQQGATESGVHSLLRPSTFDLEYLTLITSTALIRSIVY